MAYPKIFSNLSPEDRKWFEHNNENLNYTETYEKMFGAGSGLLSSIKEYVWNDEPFESIKIRVPLGYMFLMGDNAYESFDGRYFGFVPEENIIGKPLLIYWPINRIGIPK